MRKTHGQGKPTKAQKRAGAKPGVPAEYADNARGIRLQKAMADAGVASRRACEEMIEAGRVEVNGQLVKALPAWVDPAEDVIEVDGHKLPRRKQHTAKELRGKSLGATPFDRVVLAVHKPKRVICTNDDPEGRRKVIDLVDAPFAQRLFPIGRLDFESTGLILLTNDGELAQRLTHPSYEVPKQYLVTVKGRVEDEDLKTLQKGLFLAVKDDDGNETGSAKRAKIEQISIMRRDQSATRGQKRGIGREAQSESTVLSITLKEGQNREIRRLLARVGYPVKKLKRVAIGPVRLKGLAVGAWRPLHANELRKLSQAVGL